MQAVIFANGVLDPPPNLGDVLASAGQVIAADGGAQHCRTLGVRPHVIIGDFDSLSETTRAAYEAEGVQIIPYPADKDQTDLELALLHAKEAGADELFVIAGLGTRWDHSFANLLLGAHKQFSSVTITFLQGQQRMFIVRAAAHIAAKPGELLSLIPVIGDATGITTHGLKFPLRGETVQLGSSRGISNVVVSEGAEVQLSTGLLLCIISPSEVGGINES